VLLGVFGGMGLPFALVIPFIVERFGAVRSLFLGTTVPGLAGVAGMLWAPTSAPWLWVLLLSLPTAMFPLVMVLVGLRTRSHTTTIALSAAVQSIGYSVAALFPVVMGAMHEGTRGWESSLWLLAALFALGIPAGLVAARPGAVEDMWERRTGNSW
jgi:CP family cyanate transporter-like MFS transporter